ncbi:hypothetical protein [Actinoplanes derwentensis]|uniref:EcsC protein family protein n=1 Tax=Actinoplanes derwentensis TaxID=113562 RepID=A0A1H2D665_9ACTN|nr:hypothetical protein [Actinoplanes derwentensis]GID85679.1 hypothetical protein Ade03nite_46030 [Actinoplanes derwentensis]SDT78059.1 hypothetical protein SAMN04489716_8213 [Actinoplanes derwentensis]
MSQPDRATESDTEPGTEIVPVAARDEVGRTVAALTADDLEPGGRRRLLGRLAGQVRGSGVGRLFKPRSAVRWIADQVAEVAPHIPVRDRETLRRHFPGMDDRELAERLIRNAARATAGVGAAGGGIAAVEWIAAPTLLSAPVLLATETVAVVAIEIKLIGELHELYGYPVDGTGTERAVKLVEAWSGQRGVNPMIPGTGVAKVLGTAARKELQKSLMKRFGRNLTTLGPMLTGAAVASYLNRRATRTVGDNVHDDLRKRPLRALSARPALDD